LEIAQHAKHTINKGRRLKHKASIRRGLNSNFNTNNNTSFNTLKESKRKKKEKAYKA
jgi:hypothetical protein